MADAIQHRLNDPRIPPITSITHVDVSDDFAVAHISVSVMAPEAQRKLCLTALRSAAGLLRRQLGPELHLRHIPTLEFRLDDSLRRGLETVAVIDEAMRELGEVPEWERADEATDEPDELAADDKPGAIRPTGPTRPDVPPVSHEATEGGA